MKRSTDCCEFDSILLDVIDETLLVFGKGTRFVFYQYLEEVLQIPKNKIPTRIDDFSDGLEDLLGSGSKSMEIMIMMKLHSKIGVVWEYKPQNQWVLPDLTFKEYISFAKKYFEDSNGYEDQIGFFVKETAARELYK